MKTKLIFASLILLSIITLMLGLCACGEETPPSPEQPTTYTVKYYSDESTVVWETEAEAGTLLTDITYGGPTPAKAPSGDVHYVFVGWKIEDGARLTKDTAIYAEFKAESEYHEVIYKNYNGVELDRETVVHGSETVYMGALPTKPSDTKLYTFKGWSKSTDSITEDTVLIAQFDETPLMELVLSDKTKKESDTSYGCFVSGDGESFYFDIKAPDKLDSRGEYFKIGQKKSLNASAIAGIKNISFVDLDGSVTVEYGWRLGGGDIYYCKTVTATKSSPTVQLEFDPTYIAFYSATGTAYANRIEIRYTKDADSYNPLTYSQGITFTKLEDGSYEAKYGDVIAGKGIFDPDEKIIPDESLLEVVFPMYYLGSPVSKVSCIVGNYKTAFIPEGVTTVNFGGIYSSALENIRVPSTLQTVLYTYVKATDLSYYQTRHPNLSVYSERGAEYIGNESSPYVILLRASGNSDGMSRLAKTTRVISKGAFASKSIYTKDDTLIIPREVVSIGDNAFSSVHLDIVLEPGSKLCYLGQNAFSGARLGDFTLPKGIEVISHSVFSSTSIKTFTIPKDSLLTKIDSLAFMASSIKEIYIPATVTEIGSGAFSGCFNLTNIILEENHPSYTLIDGSLYTKDGKTLISYMSASKASVFVAPTSLVRITQNAFIDCANLKSIFLPKSTTEIDDGALYALNSAIYLELEYIPSGWHYLDYSAESVFTVWTGASLDNVVTVDGFEFVLRDDTAILTKNLDEKRSAITVPETVTKDGKTYTVTEIGRTAFYENKFDDGATLSLPKTVSIISDYAFLGCNFTSVALPERVKHIGVMAFMYVGLKEYHLPTTLVHVGTDAFTAYAPFSLYYSGSAEDFLNNVSAFDCVPTIATLYFKINGEFVSSDKITTLPTIKTELVNAELLKVFRAKEVNITLNLSQNVKRFANSFDGWILEIEQRKGMLVIRYEGTEEDFRALLEANGIASILDFNVVTVLYNQNI